MAESIAIGAYLLRPRRERKLSDRSDACDLKVTDVWLCVRRYYGTGEGERKGGERQRRERSRAFSQKCCSDEKAARSRAPGPRCSPSVSCDPSPEAQVIDSGLHSPSQNRLLSLFLSLARAPGGPRPNSTEIAQHLWRRPILCPCAPSSCTAMSFQCDCMIRCPVSSRSLECLYECPNRGTRRGRGETCPPRTADETSLLVL